ncbi:cytochrome P450 [Lojkania enalia]|uniref:Cytochrome P450 n=1 Tax=Lojkania enalia TaxID=147567 RepID=A0A9P4N0E5_9PLEO|nr:cytochrome P450 [Didymosphaeria enalia]
MSSEAPTYYKQLNTPMAFVLLSWVLSIGYVLTLLAQLFFKPETSIISKTTFAISLLCAEFAFYCSAVIAYRVWFHPLGKYPGPFLAKFTDWYSVYHCMRGDRHIDFYKLHCKYGPVVRYGPHRISMNTSKALREIYHVRSNCQKSQLFIVFSHFFKVQSIMTTLHRKEHALKRRIVTEALAPYSLKQMESRVMQNVRIFCDKMIDNPIDKNNVWNSARNMSEWCGWLANDIMGDITFHRNWKMLESEDHRDVITILSRGVGGLITMAHMPRLLDLKLDKIFFRRATEDTYKVEKLSTERTNWRLGQRDNIKERDIFGTLAAVQDSETKRCLTREELIAETAFFIIAGADTTGSAMTATIFYLLHNPNCYQRLQEEVLSSFTSLEDIHSGKQLDQCLYLHACITEAMRLSPGVGGILPREVLQPGMWVDKHFFPPGTDVGVSNYAIHHNIEYFPSPFTFKPERWLSDSVCEGGVSVQEVKLAQSAYSPFGVGRTNCVGQNLAYQEIMTVIARLLFLYDMRIKPGTTMGEGSVELGPDRCRKDELQTWDRFVSYHEGPMVEFRPR